MENIIDSVYEDAKRVCKDFEIKNLEVYHDLFVQSDSLLLVDLFENSRNMCLDPPKIFLALGLAW